MREPTVASVARRIVRAVTRAVEAVARGAETALTGALPQPQLAPVRVRANRR